MLNSRPKKIQRIYSFCNLLPLIIFDISFHVCGISSISVQLQGPFQCKEIMSHCDTMPPQYNLPWNKKSVSLIRVDERNNVSQLSWIGTQDISSPGPYIYNLWHRPTLRTKLRKNIRRMRKMRIWKSLP